MPLIGSTSLDVMRFEIEGQVEGLREYSRYLLSNRKPLDTAAEEILFAGSGDSYCAALWAHEMSHGKSQAYDPFELGLKPHWAAKKQVAIISVSGRTRANLFLAKRLKGVGARLVAVTGSSESELAKECDETVLLQYRAGEMLTSGTASFTASLLACANLLGELDREVELAHNFHAHQIVDSDLAKRGSPTLKKVLQKMQHDRERVIARDGLVLFIGTGIDYPLAQYGAYKFNEVLGVEAFPSYPEPVGHALLFSLDPEKDRVVILDPSSNRRLREVNQVLADLGLPVYRIHVPPQNPLSRTMELALEIQMLAYNLARDQGMKECAFVSNKSRLEASSHLIY